MAKITEILIFLSDEVHSRLPDYLEVVLSGAYVVALKYDGWSNLSRRLETHAVGSVLIN